MAVAASVASTAAAAAAWPGRAVQPEVHPLLRGAAVHVVPDHADVGIGVPVQVDVPLLAEPHLHGPAGDLERERVADGEYHDPVVLRVDRHGDDVTLGEPLRAHLVLENEIRPGAACAGRAASAAATDPRDVRLVDEERARPQR